MTIKEMREFLNKMEAETGTDNTNIYFRDGELGYSSEVNWGYSETDEEGRTYIILRD